MNSISFLESGSSRHDTLMCLGFWVLIGIISFVICEKLVAFAKIEDDEEEDDQKNEDGIQEEEDDEEENFETEISLSDSSNNNVEKKPNLKGTKKKNSMQKHSSHNQHVSGK